MISFYNTKALLSCSLLFSLLLFTLSSANVSAQTFTFTAIPDQDETRLQQRFDKAAHYLEDTLKIKVRYIPVKSYSAAITAFRNNQVQLAWFGGLSGVQARRLVPGSVAIAQGYEDQFFKTYLIANASTMLSKTDKLPPALNSFTFTFGSKGSTSGRLMPEFYLRQHFDKAPSEIFKHVGFSGDHSRTIALVQSGAYDLGAVNYQVWEKELAEGKIQTDKIHIIWETPSYQDYHWTIRGDVDQNWGPGFAQKVKATLIAIDDPELLQAFPRSRFVSAESSDYQGILEVAKKIGLID